LKTGKAQGKQPSEIRAVFYGSMANGTTVTRKNFKGKIAKAPVGIVRQERLAKQLSEYDGRSKKRHKPHNMNGRPKGQPNNISRLTREAIFEGLSRCGGREGMVGFVIKATNENIKNGVAMLNMITPRIVDAVVTHNDMIFQSLAEVDTALAARGLPTSQEIFKLDYRGDPDDDSVVIENEKDNVSS
jgi:hypothetical protein